MDINKSVMSPIDAHPLTHMHGMEPRIRPHFGIAHALCLGLAPWLAAEVPYMVEVGRLAPRLIIG